MTYSIVMLLKTLKLIIKEFFYHIRDGVLFLCLVFISSLIILLTPLLILLDYIFKIISSISKDSDFTKYKKIQMEGYNFILTRSKSKEFDNYILSRLKEFRLIKVFYSQNLDDYPSYCNLKLYSLDNSSIVFNLDSAYRKFKYTKVKIDNLISKVKEIDRRASLGDPILDLKELNLSNIKEGFGHQQNQNSTSLTAMNTSSSFQHESKFLNRGKTFFILLSLFLIFHSLIRSLSNDTEQKYRLHNRKENSHIEKHLKDINFFEVQKGNSEQNQ